MNTRIVSALVFAGLCGCTVPDAIEAQKSVKDKGEGIIAEFGLPTLNLRTYSLEALVAYAMTNHPSVTSARLQVQDARLALKALAADAPIISSTPWTAPNLSLGAGYSEASEPVVANEWDGRTTPGDPTASLSLDLLLWDFGRYDARSSQQAELVTAAELALANAGFAVFYDVSSAYFTFLERRSLREVAETNFVNYADHLARAEAQLGAGEANKLDVLRARLDMAQARQALVSASNNVETAGAALMNALGIDASKGTASSVFGDERIGIDSVQRGFDRSVCDVDSAFAFARTNAPTMKINRARLRASSHAVDFAMRDLLPSVSASASLNWTDPFWFWRWGLNVSQNLFQGFRKTTAVDQAVVAMKKAETEVDAAEQALSVDLETAIANRDNSVSAVASAMASVKSARENLDMINEQLSLGDVSRIELSEAIYAFSKATGDAIMAFYDGQRAEARLFVLLGKYPVYHEEVLRGQK